ncbi:hypothetical protein SD37_04370 [Amycolatopsis orientalis]|uniref:Uncharacterized protein n=1 Tax=Amycolatopsis orientalis TaxID=31958 RepID=A0A193CB67_AMYOR|nr:hypothetical protein [Amycolatopsis orientalis]ANN21550.1 hypothetical protein SD37_04370 [Amycolatopsis orientalis]
MKFRSAALCVAGAALVSTMAGAGQANATRPSSLVLSPSTVVAGGTVTADIYCLRPSGAGELATTLVANGLAAPIPLRVVGDGGTGGIGVALRGDGPVGTVPGRYTASYDCWGWIVRAEFTVTS